MSIDESNLPGGLDVNALSRLANQFLRELDGENPAGGFAPTAGSPLPAPPIELSPAASAPAAASSLPAEVSPAIAPALTFAAPAAAPVGASSLARAAEPQPQRGTITAHDEFRAPLGPNLHGASSNAAPRVPGGAPSPGGFSPGATVPSAFYFLEPHRALEPSVRLEQLHAGPAHPGSTSLFGATSHFGSPAQLVPSSFDVARVRRDFPILSETVNGRRLVWLDNAATTQKPQSVIDRLSSFYERENSNIHRAAHELAARATDAYEGAREKVRGFLNARSTNEIVFVRGATEAINLVAQTWGRANVGPGDEIVVSWLEHHANIVPWQILAQERGARLRVIPVDDDGQILLDEYAKLLNPRTKLVSFTQVSNALGTVTPARQIVEMARATGALTLVDGAQAVSHMPVDVRALDADFYVFSGHKVFGPTGIGVLYGKEALLNQLPPWQGGGNMIQDVTFEKTAYHPAPFRFEAGTGNIADAVGLGAAIDYVTRLGMHAIESYEHQLLEYGTRRLRTIPGLRLVGTAAHKAGVLSFVLDGFRTDEVSSTLNEYGIAVRGGHHCAQPILRRFGLESTVRPSLAFYNDCSDIDALTEALLEIIKKRR